MTTSEETLITSVIDWVRAHRQPGVSEDMDISAETDLLESGLLDSLGIVDLLLFLEQQHGCKVDLIDVDPAEFAIVRGLCRVALGHRSER